MITLRRYHDHRHLPLNFNETSISASLSLSPTQLLRESGLPHLLEHRTRYSTPSALIDHELSSSANDPYIDSGCYKVRYHFALC